MKPELIALCTDQLQRDAAQRFGLNPDSITPLDGFENVVLETSNGDRPYIIRLSHSSHRTSDQIQAELDWLDFLAAHEVSVCKPLRSRAGRLTEWLEVDGGGFIATVFEKAPGGMATRETMSSERAYNRGQLIGSLHRLTREYTPPDGHPVRHHWHTEDDFANCRKFLTPEDEPIAQKFDQLQTELLSLPTSRDDYGLIHMDAHHGNMFFDGDRPVLFDFDDCAHDFFVSDIAISLFYQILPFPDSDERTNMARDFLSSFLDGYRTEYGLDNRWLEVIPMILRRREMVLYVAIHRATGSEDFDEWCQRYFNAHRPRILNDTPYVDLDWSQFRLS